MSLKVQLLYELSDPTRISRFFLRLSKLAVVCLVRFRLPGPPTE